MTIARPTFESIVSAGASARSGDNCQPWRVTLRPDGFELHVETARSRALLDVDQLASRISAGAFLEAARLEASRLGVQMHVELDPEPARRELWARATLAPGRATETDPLAHAIFERHTNRSRFDGQPLTTAELTALRRAVAADVTVSLVEDRRSVAAIARAAAAGERIRAHVKTAHEDMHRWLRWDPQAATSTRDGLDVRTLGLDRFERLALRLLAPWRRMRFALRLGVARANARWARRLAASASTIAVLSVHVVNRDGAVALGRSLERLWLAATQAGLHASPMMALPLLALAADRGLDELAPWRSQLTSAAAALATAAAIPAGQRPLVILRVGRGQPASVRALRRPLALLATSEVA